MSYRYQKAHKDSNHDSLVNTARRIGASVAETHGVGKSFPDLIAHLNETVLIEVKTPDGKFYVAQLRFLAEWRGYSAFVSTDEELISVLRFPKIYCLTEKDKRRILKIVLEYENKTKAKTPQIAVKTFDALFEKERKN